MHCVIPGRILISSLFIFFSELLLSSGLKAQCAAIPGGLGGNGAYCIGAQVSVGIPETVPGQEYIWYLNSKPVKKLPADGNGGAVSFNFAAGSDLAGNYVVKAIKPGCNPTIFGNVTVTLDPNGVAAQTLTGGPDCSGGNGVPLIMGGSQSGVTYQLLVSYNGNIEDASFISELPGTGNAIDFGFGYADGVYFVKAYGLGCSGAVCASAEVYFHVNTPFSQNFNTTGNVEFPMCWSQGVPVVGTSNISFETGSSSPATVPYEGTRFVFWNSASHPAGNETRLLMPLIKPNGNSTLDVEFYWYNNNNTALTPTQNSTEGVQLQAYISGVWQNVGSFIPRHDASLPAGTGQWKKKTITVPNVTQSGINLSFKFRSEHGNNCSLDAMTVKPTPACIFPTGLDISTYGTNSVNLAWNAIPGATAFQYAVTESSTPPASGTSTTGTSATVGGLNPGTQYYLHVRTQCAFGFSPWSKTSFFTLSDCANATPVTLCTPFNVNIPTGRGIWDFKGTYPINSTGDSTIGKEKLFKFTPPTTGVYYLENISASYVHALYKPFVNNTCMDTGWIGLIANQAKSPFGLLQGGVEYLIVFDAKFTSGGSGSFQICKATTAAPALTNNCIDINYGYPVAANSTKEEYILDEAGNLIASLDLSKVDQQLDYLQFSYFTKTGPTRRDLYNKEYLDRSFSIYHTYFYNQYPIKVKLFFRNADLQKLIDEPDDGIADVNNINDLIISTGEGTCSPTADGGYSLVPQIENGAYDANSSFIVGNLNLWNSYSSFFIHGGNLPLNYQCPNIPTDYPVLPVKEGFNPSNSYTLPGCWSETRFGSYVAFLSSSSNPATETFEGPRYIFYNSYNFPEGTSTILNAPPVKTTGKPSVDVEFYWYNNNNPLYTSIVEGVQVEYSVDGTTWTWATFVQRHDPSLPVGTGKWKKKKITLPANAGNRPALYVRFIFFSQFGDNCAMDALRIAPTPPCTDVQQININSFTSTSVNFNWSAVPGVSTYEYAVTTDANPPQFGSFSFTTNASANSLIPLTKYYIHLRPQCSPGVNGDWTTTVFTTAHDCSLAPSISICTDVTATILPGNGIWTFPGSYPNNSVGFSTPGKEAIYRFTPSTTGVYYLQVMSSSGGYIDYLYKPSSMGCSDNNWIGINDIQVPDRFAIGLLQAGVEYLILLDGESTTGSTQTFRICKATTAPPFVLNNCIALLDPPKPIPANSTKEEFILDVDGNLIASLDFSSVSNSVGYAYASYYVNSSAIRRDNRNKEYLDRSISIVTDIPPDGTVKVKLFFTNADLQRLINEPNDGNADVTGIADLNITRAQQNCAAAAQEQAASLLPQTANGSYDATSSYIQFSTPGFSSFYLHGGFIPLFQGQDSAILCPGGNSTFAIAPVGTGYTYQWQLNTGSGFVNINNNSNYSGTATTTLTLMNTPSTWYGYKFRCVATNGGNTIISPVKTLKFAVTWNGGSTSNWELNSNWNCGVPPDENTDVIIPSGVTNMPVISNNVSCRSLRVVNGATITIATGMKLDIKGK